MGDKGKHFDVLIIGAGLSGIGMACRLIKEETGLSYAILERRERVGGTWDLFKYPGIRSDSDMYTFGYGFRPWTGTHMLAPGADIRQYVEDTANEYGVLDNVHFGLKFTKASWSSADELWTVEVVNEATGAKETYTSRFLAGCTGYYNYDKGYRPSWPGEENFKGQWVHPQFWPEDLDYKGKKVVVIGSGATAVTLIPNMVDEVGHVTMLQRSPTYIMPIPGKDPLAVGIQSIPGIDAIPGTGNIAYALGRPRQVMLQTAMYNIARRAPRVMKSAIRLMNQVSLGDKVDIKHFTPTYEPWDQRICFVPDNDLFKALKSGKADIVTDHIEKFVEDGIITKSGEKIEADIVVTATGLDIQLLGGGEVFVDGEKVTMGDRLLYKGALAESIPNAVIVIGYINMSWTLKSDLVAVYFCRLVNYMRDNGFTTFIAHGRPEDRTEATVMGAKLKSGYIERAASQMPKQGKGRPWEALQDYIRDNVALRYNPLEDGVLEFRGHDADGDRIVIGGFKLPGVANQLANKAGAPGRWLSRHV
ncbi:MAG: NAD(P)/FAD-dependent oxidoreductase [Nocardiaceae bacterium]|nr:NAD(P)/FAD-dependent oxidoreductase [Nocardiaceae bacterium]